MGINQFDIIAQFCVRIATILILTAIVSRLAQKLSRPRGTYGAGLPERRSRKRIVLPDPATLPPPVPRTSSDLAA